MSIDTAADQPATANTDPMVDEAERILGGQADAEDSGERVYTVGQDGTVRDWRKPDDGQADEILTKELAVANGDAQVGDPVLVDGRRGTVAQFLFRPARNGKKNRQPGGWDVVIAFAEGEPKEARVNATEVHLLLDEITRASKTPRSQETTGYGVPTEASFGDDDVKEAGDLRQMAHDLIEETGDFPKFRSLLPRGIVYFWGKKGGSTGGQPVLYRVRFATKHERKELGWRVVYTFSADVVRDQLLNRDDLEAIVHESLCVIERDEHGNLRKLAPDFRGYERNVGRYGTRVPLVRVAAEALAEEVEDIRNLRLDLDGAEEPELADVGV